MSTPPVITIRQARKEWATNLISRYRAAAVKAERALADVQDREANGDSYVSYAALERTAAKLTKIEAQLMEALTS